MADFELTDPEVFTAGAVGEPGRRVFFLQGRQAGAVVTLRLEKQQVVALAEYLGGLLAELNTPITEPLPTDLALVEPAVEEWIVGSLLVAYNEAADRFLVVAEELMLEADSDEEDERAGGGALEPDGGDEPSSARFHLTRAQAAAFVARAAELAAAGRPMCPVCGRPIDADGHVCARSNGHRH
jgi:uncharacterized repeat protein (TIGR03847 family)